MANFEIGQKVSAHTQRGKTARPGVIVAFHGTTRGNWVEIKPDDGTSNFKTRPAKIDAI